MKAAARRLERIGSNFDWTYFILLLAICGCGLVVLSSAGYDPDTGVSRPMQKQALSMVLGVIAFFVGCLCSATFWKRSSWAIYGGCLILLAVIFLIGEVAGGARRWLDLGFFRMQPSEFMKIGVILVLANVLSSETAPTNGYNLKTLIYPAIILLIPAALTLVQPDLGTALCQCLVGGSMIFVAGVRRKTILGLMTTGLIAAIPAWSFLKEYQKKRILNFVTPELDPLASGYHAIQSKIAVGSGSLFGKGYLKGTQTQLRFLPEQTTDFLFSVLAEEWGFVGTFLVVSLYIVLVYRILRIASRASDRFTALVCVGVGALFFWQCVVNIGMVTGTLPVVGITLPLLSYGGSSVLTLLFCAGLVAGVHSRRFLFS
jgi:rod shape determining protein RodA